MKLRTKADKCLICQVNDANETGSHLMPAGLSTPCDNGRSKEELYFIGETINVYYGSANQRNNNFIHDIERHHNYNVMDHIFCVQCEKKLSVIENAIIPFLNNVVPSNKGFDKQEEVGQGIICRDYSNVDLAELKLFFYTVIWRLGLAQELNFGNIVFSSEEYEKLRSLIDTFLSDEIENIRGNQDILNEIPLTILTSNFKVKSANYYSPHRIRNNPSLFVVCQYLVFIYFKKDATLNPNFRLPLEVLDKMLINENNMPLKIGILTDRQWYRFLTKEFRYRAIEFREIRIKDLAEKTGKSYQECGFLIHSRTFEIQVSQLMEKLGVSKEVSAKLYKEKGERLIHRNHLKGYGFSFDDAYRELIEKNAP